MFGAPLMFSHPSLPTANPRFAFEFSSVLLRTARAAGCERTQIRRGGDNFISMLRDWEGKIEACTDVII